VVVVVVVGGFSSFRVEGTRSEGDSGGLAGGFERLGCFCCWAVSFLRDGFGFGRGRGVLEVRREIR